MSGRLALSGEDLWLVRLAVLLRAAKEPVCEESILAEFERRHISGVTAPGVRTVLASLARKKLIRQVKGTESHFGATRRGREAVIEGAARLRALFNASDVKRSSKQSETEK
jgi:hypothetical protein